MRAPSELINVNLAGGNHALIRCGKTDISVAEVVRATRGLWEPHIQTFFERAIAPDWTCIDVGANVGIHTLSLAALAPNGRVVAFEADPQNYAWLEENVADFASPHAEIEIAHRALWDTNDTIKVASFQELAGCSFASIDGDLSENERRIRQILDAPPVRDLRLHQEMHEIAAERLDDWIAAKKLTQVDFVKVDIEGAEAHMIRGALLTLMRHRPLLLTEYNPACAACYFDEPPDAYYNLLRTIYPMIRILRPDASLSEPLLSWSDLRAELEHRLWADLVCSLNITTAG